MSSDKNTPKRKAADIEVPAVGKDAAERKRALNVLAQRRYRQRKKEHVKKLEAQVASPTSKSVQENQHGFQTDFPTPPPEQGGRQTVDLGLDEQTGQCLYSYPPDLNQAVPILSETVVEEFSHPAASHQVDIQQLPAFSSSTPEDALDSESLQSAFLFTPLDTNPFTFLPSLPPTPRSTTEDWSASNSNTESNSSITSPSSTDNALSRAFSPPLPNVEDPMHFDFPDEANLRMLELDLLRAGVAIARRMHIDDILWNMDATSPYTDPAMHHMDWSHLPINLWPTKTQLTIPHHPFIDLLPWPTVRNKLLTVFSQPVEMRPPSAKSPTAMLDVIYDIEDSAEGVRVWGDDPCSNLNWEVGQKVFERWWWAFDREIISRSNELRKRRGAPLLGAGFVVGELA